VSRRRQVRTRWLLLASLLWLHAGAVGAQLAEETAAPDLMETDGPVPTSVDQPFFDLDAYLDNGGASTGVPGDWGWQLLPTDLIYKSYLAGLKEPRAGTTITWVKDDSRMWDGILGARLGLLRFGDHAPLLPQGFQLDAEGAAIVRLDVDNEVDVRATDYRVGMPLTYGIGVHQFKFGFYHMSSHLGDEFVLRHPGYPRLNWSRNALVLGYSIYVTETLRLYAEAGWAFQCEINEPWEFQFGADWAPNAPTGFRGAPFFALNGHLREEVDFGGTFTVMTGWSWMTERDRHLLRCGVEYYNGKCLQYSFHNQSEDAIGMGLWYDF
jgi:hypothetical protein